MRSFRFVHASDLHLNSPFQGLSADMPDVIRNIVLESTFIAYENVIDLCLEEEVSALLIAGDVYDGADRDLDAQLRFIAGLERLNKKGIKSFICHGNHDPLDGWQYSVAFPKPNCYRFQGDAGTFPLFDDHDQKVFVHGISYPKREVRENLIPYFADLEKGEFNIGLIHANVNRDTEHDPYAPCELSDLVATGYDYWALGHVHTRRVLNEASPTVIYPGNSQSKHINEKGPRGVYLVDVDQYGSVSTEFVAVDVFRCGSVEMNLSDIESMQEFLERIDSVAGNLLENSDGRHMILRINVTGATPLHAELTRQESEEGIRNNLNRDAENNNPFIWFQKIEISTTPPIDKKQLAKGTDFIAEVLRLGEEIKSSKEELEALFVEANGIYSRGAVGDRLKFLGPQDRKEMLQMVEEAEQIYLAQLLKDEIQ